MKRIPRVGDIVVITGTCHEDNSACYICDSVIGRTALVGIVNTYGHVSLRFQRTTGLRSGYFAHQLYVTGLTA